MVPRLPDGQVLAHAHDRGDSRPEGGLGLRVHRRVVLAVVAAALGVPDHNVGAAELGQHRPGHIAGVGAAVVGREVLRPVADPQLVPRHQRLHAAERGERRQHHDLGGVEVPAGEAEGQLLDQGDRFQVGEVHLPVAGHERHPAAAPVAPGAAHVASSAVSPGSAVPSRYSRLAPPPVEMWVNASSGKPSSRTAAAESPPPTTVRPVTALIASVTARVPAANAGNSNTPGGPFQNTVFASASLRVNSSRVAGPMSSAILPAGTSGPATTSALASAPTWSATTWSTGSTTSTPARAASARTADTCGI